MGAFQALLLAYCMFLDPSGYGVFDFYGPDEAHNPVLSSADIRRALSGNYIRLDLSGPRDTTGTHLSGDDPYFIEHFEENANWMRTEFQAASKSWSGSWTVVNDKVCVNYSDGRKCRKVYAYSGKHIRMQSWRLETPVDYKLVTHRAHGLPQDKD